MSSSTDVPSFHGMDELDRLILPYNLQYELSPVVSAPQPVCLTSIRTEISSEKFSGWDGGLISSPWSYNTPDVLSMGIDPHIELTDMDWERMLTSTSDGNVHSLLSVL